ncbi:hypothetical protein Taro_053692 [Colocasia esculenta]|uniref:Uncharacterized protein n=1 Tax=Colocasia esculenta TaxID=4460 RepID=A0A843XLX5_COLES|nr:hypothetical protein [Colocasia esculenta]
MDIAPKQDVIEASRSAKHTRNKRGKMSAHHEWMYRRIVGNELSPKCLEGVDGFIDFAVSNKKLIQKNYHNKLEPYKKMIMMMMTRRRRRKKKKKKLKLRLFTLRSGALSSSTSYGSFYQWFTLYYGAPPSPSYYGFFHQRFTLHSGAPPSPSYHSSFHHRFTLHSGAPPSPSYYGSFHQRFTLHSGAPPYYGPPSASYYRPYSTA